MARLQFEISSYWHVGTGGGIHGGLDASQLRDHDGLPYLPGRSVKGLVREALRQGEALGHLKAGTCIAYCGEAGFDTSQRNIPVTQPGKLLFSDARLHDGERAKLSSASPEVKARLFRTLQSTAIEQSTGVAKDATLRTIEVSVPMTLYADLGSLSTDDKKWTEDLIAVLPLIRGVGAHRTRGLGRVSVRVVS